MFYLPCYYPSSILRRVSRSPAQSTAPRSGTGRMNTVIGTNETGNAKLPGRLSIRCAGAGFPALAARIRMRMKRGDHDRVWQQGRVAEIKGGLLARGCSHRAQRV